MTVPVTDSSRGSASPPRTGVGRLIGALAALVIGSLLAAGAVSLLLAGGTAVWAAGQAGSDGYFQTPAVAVNTTTYALISPPIELDAGPRSNNMGENYMGENFMGENYMGENYMGENGMGEMRYLGDDGSMSFNLGSLRLSAESAGSTPVFIGVAPSSDVNAYLADVSHAVVTQANAGPTGNRLREIAGSQAPTPPAEQSFWTLAATGAGEQNLVWNFADRAAQDAAGTSASYTLVVMNADASETVNVDLRGGARSDLIAPLGWGLLIGGLALLLVAVVLIVLGIVLLVRQPARRGASGPNVTPADSVHL